MGKFASQTSVPVEKSKAEIEATVRRYGAEGFIAGWEGDRAMLQFKCQDRYVRFLMAMPDRKEKRFTEYRRRGSCSATMRSPAAAEEAWEQACRQIWRALALMVKAKLEGVDSGIATFEAEFLANIVMPDGKTVYEKTRELIAIAYEKGDMPTLLPDYSRPQ